nr:MAG TPA: hypothetical protein [Bacteriophage sp.]
MFPTSTNLTLSSTPTILVVKVVGLSISFTPST